jgi:hypothetical protein
MFPETEFHKRGSLMFLIVDGRYYNVSEAEFVEGDYLNLGIRFPLKEGTTILEEERVYMKRNSRLFEEYKQRFREKVKVGEESIEDIKKDIEEKSDLLFFLEQVCPLYDRNLTLPDFKKIERTVNAEVEKCFMPDLITQDYAVINGRLYPLIPTEEHIFVSLDGKKYTFGSSSETVDEIEGYFQTRLNQLIKWQAMQEIENLKTFRASEADLGKRINLLETLLSIGKSRYCYEYARLGYVPYHKRIYFLILPHYNHTTARQYGEGQSAVTLPFVKGIVGTDIKFMERKSRNHQFELDNTQSFCLEVYPKGDTLLDKLDYLYSAAHVIWKNQAFHE